MSKELLEAALKYREMGFSVFPVNPKDKRPAIASWLKYQAEIASIEEITEWFGKLNHQGIAIVTGKVSNLFVVDFDKYKPDFKEEIALQYFPDNLVTPTVKTMSGGQHLYFRYPDIDITIRAGIFPGIDYRGQGGYVVAPPTRNQLGHGYEWITSFDDAPAALLPDVFKNALIDNSTNNSYIYTGASHAQLQNVTDVTSCDIWANGKRDENLFHVALCLAKANSGEAYVFQTLKAIMASWGEYDEKWINSKIKSAFDRKNKRERPLMAEIQEWLSVTGGDISVTECDKELQIVTKEEKANRRQIFHRLVREGVLERKSNKVGMFRYIDKSDDEAIDIFGADLTPYDVRLPLDIHEYVTIHKSNIIIIAGESNSGKTSFCLNVARMNRKKQPINYLSSEMQDGTELRIRLNEFDEPIENWKPVKFTFRTDNFPDKIKPDALNIIDYLDEGAEGEAYKMGLRIKEISTKLKAGVAVIAIQKDPNKQFGYGGSGTLNRARLYLTTTTKGVMTIEKGKIWRNKTWNPNGSYIEYRLVGGCKYHPVGDWIRR